MDEARLKTWETLFQRALDLIDSVSQSAKPLDDWTFGGGTVLMRRHRHRFSKDVDIFIPDPQYLSLLSPRLNAIAEKMTSNYVEDTKYIKLRFPEGEIDFVVSGPLIEEATQRENILGREVNVETSAEIICEKSLLPGKRLYGARYLRPRDGRRERAKSDR